MLLRQHLTPASIGLAVGVGVFIGSLPVYGLHVVLCVLVARWLRLNQALVYVAANISNPVVAPFLVAAQVGLGEWLRHGVTTPPPALAEGDLCAMASAAPDLFVSCLLGSVVSGVVLALTLGGGGYGLARAWRARRPGPAQP